MHSTQSYHISDTPFIWCRLLGIRNTIGSCWLRMHVAQTLLWWHQRSSSLKFAIVCSSCHFFSHVIFIQMISVSFYLMSISIVYVTTILNNQLNYFRSADQENVKKKKKTNIIQTKFVLIQVWRNRFVFDKRQERKDVNLKIRMMHSKPSIRSNSCTMYRHMEDWYCRRR